MSMSRIGSMLALTAVLATGCATHGGPAVDADAKIVAHQSVRHGSADSTAFYALGKQHLADGRVALARDAFGRAIAANDRDADARNGSAVAAMRAGDVDEAVRQLQAAVEIAPRAAHLHGNLGYAWMLKGDDRAAARALHRALQLDPADARVRENWRVLQRRFVIAQSGAGSRRAAEHRDAATSRHGAAAGASSSPFGRAVLDVSFDRPPEGPAFTVRFDGEPQAALGGTLAPAAAPDNVERRPGARAEPALRIVALRLDTAASSPTGPVPVSAAARLEIINGNGQRGAAARVAQWLRSTDRVVTRVTNAARFDHDRTFIEFRDGYRDSAADLARQLSVDAVLVPAPAPRLDPRVDLRVVVGRDMAGMQPLERTRRAAGVGVVALVR